MHSLSGISAYASFFLPGTRHAIGQFYSRPDPPSPLALYSDMNEVSFLYTSNKVCINRELSVMRCIVHNTAPYCSWEWTAAGEVKHSKLPKSSKGKFIIYQLFPRLNPIRILLPRFCGFLLILYSILLELFNKTFFFSLLQEQEKMNRTAEDLWGLELALMELFLLQMLIREYSK